MSLKNPYDPHNIFAQIIRGDAPCTRVYEDEWVLAFYDIAQMAPIHVLVIPKNSYVDLQDFLNHANSAEICGFWQGVKKTVEILDVQHSGYNLFTSIGADHGQDVFHFHVHITAGKTLADILS
jgi:histidine triad (HIT) family protein